MMPSRSIGKGKKRLVICVVPSTGCVIKILTNSERAAVAWRPRQTNG